MSLACWRGGDCTRSSLENEVYDPAHSHIPPIRGQISPGLQVLLGKQLEANLLVGPDDGGIVGCFVFLARFSGWWQVLEHMGEYRTVRAPLRPWAPPGWSRTPPPPRPRHPPSGSRGSRQHSLVGPEPPPGFAGPAVLEASRRWRESAHRERPPPGPKPGYKPPPGPSPEAGPASGGCISLARGVVCAARGVGTAEQSPAAMPPGPPGAGPGSGGERG